MFTEISQWEQKQVTDAYPHMKGYEGWFWKNYNYLEKLFRRSYLLGTVLFIAFVILLLVS